MSVQIGTANYKIYELREGIVSLIVYTLMFIPWLYASAISLLNWYALQIEEGDHWIKLLLLQITIFGLMVAFVAIVIMIGVSWYYCKNPTTRKRTYWEWGFFRIRINVMAQPYLIGQFEYDRSKWTARPDIAAIVATLACLGVAATAIPGWVPEPSVLGLDNLGLALVFFLAGVATFCLGLACAADDIAD